MRATAIFTVLSVPLIVVLPLLVAIPLARKFPGRNFFRAVIVAPYVLGVAVIGILWRYLLDPNVGVLASFLDRVGLDSPPWLTDTPWVWGALVIPTIWWTLGYNMVIFLAGLQDISRELYEAADMDGASPVQQFFNVTLPGLRPVMIFVVTITLLASANLFGQSYIITQGQPGRETRSAIMQIAEEGLARFNMGSSAAMSTILTLCLLLISLVMLSFTRERDAK
jgi:multiple sugar transport system permease protein